MAKGKRGPSPHTRRRHALARLGDLEAQRAKFERSRPRTPGKKGAKTRALNTLARQIAAAKGQVTRALSAIARAASAGTSRKSVARQKRSAAAKKGWVKRLARLAASVASDGAKLMPMLTRDGIIWINPIGDDRSLLGIYWTAVADRLNNVPTLLLDGFDWLSVVDSETGRSYPFITDMETILQYNDYFDFGPSFYKSRGELPGASE